MIFFFGTMGIFLLVPLFAALCSGVPVHRVRPRAVTSRATVSGGRMRGFYSLSLELERQTVSVLLDTGSSLFGVVGKGCRVVSSGNTCAAPGGRLLNVGDLHPVSCGELPGCCRGQGGDSCVASVGYLDGTQAQGPVYLLQARMPDSNTSAVPVFVGVIEKEQGHFSTSDSHGILGLGVVPHGAIPDYLSMLEQHGQPALIGMCLTDEGGDVTFGKLDPSKTTGTIQYAPLIKPATSWAIMLNSFSFASGGGGSVSAQGMRAIVDSGTTVILVPTAMLADIVTALKQICVSNRHVREFLCAPDGNIFSVPDGQCREFSPDSIFPYLPDLEVNLAPSISVRVPGKNYIRWEERSGQACGVFGVMALEKAPQDMVLLGDVFLRSTFAVFDRTEQRIGFGPAVNCTVPAEHGGGRRDPLIIVGVIGVALVVGIVVFIIFVRISQSGLDGRSQVAPDAERLGGGSGLSSVWSRLTTLFRWNAAAGGSHADAASVAERRLAAFEKLEEQTSRMETFDDEDDVIERDEFL